MAFNADKCLFLKFSFNGPFPDFPFNNTTTENVAEEEILWILIYNKLNL